MWYLLVASLLWAFSFGLIKGQLTGVDPALVSLVRLALATLAFLPFWRPFEMRWRQDLQAMGLGALQFGLMYVLYISSFAYLPAWMVALFTIFTPLYVVGLAAVRQHRASWHIVAAAVLAVAGAGVVVAQGLPENAAWRGIILLQGANLAFAVGQVLYGDLKRKQSLGDVHLMGRMYLGGCLVPALWLLAHPVAQGSGLEMGHWPALVYLGLIPTAVGFYLWNKGAALVSAGLLGVANNLKVPLAVLVSWVVFGEDADYWRTGLGLLLVVAGLFLAGYDRNGAAKKR
jgi:drug/metabolite transporter (DMT)-like permease|nr:EamA family transporter [Candidatus Krumholzibacteria bacterium]